MNNSSFEWAVIGAGPAGMAAIGQLIEHGVNASNIVWIDPEFNVGDFGTRWRKVSSNTRVGLFLKFFEACESFQYDSVSSDFAIKQLDPDKTCLLDVAAEPLRRITENLKNKVHAIKGKAQQLKLSNRQWKILLANETLYAKNVILATGAEPKSLPFPGVEEIHLDIALDPDKLDSSCNKDDIVAVFGSSHSAILILKTLLEKCQVKKVINFYLSPLRYAVYFDDWILFDNTGLKGMAADWARENINGKLPAKLERIIAHEENIRFTLPLCHKAIYAIGFQKRLISVEGMHALEYNDKNGIIAPGLFGLGIAFPEAKIDRNGTLEYRVGLWKFMEYLNHVMPIWLKYTA
ncbi:MAG: FAD-dependent oxidoreductase [Gammaproteobacteria bacterium]|nr:FAD-dependent oxidoreductase [Gammaproteobacteria bacterium]